MKNLFLKDYVRLVGVKRFDGDRRLIDYYIDQPGSGRIYAFTKVFTRNTYDLCKSGIMINELLTKRSKDHGLMRLVKHTKIMLPYLTEFYDLKVRAS